MREESILGRVRRVVVEDGKQSALCPSPSVRLAITKIKNHRNQKGVDKTSLKQARGIFCKASVRSPVSPADNQEQVMALRLRSIIYRIKIVPIKLAATSMRDYRRTRNADKGLSVGLVVEIADREAVAAKLLAQL
jgi:hypothetical protein